MSEPCFIIPERVLQAVVDKGEAPQHVRDKCHGTIEKSRRLRDRRHQKVESITSAAGAAPTQDEDLQRTIYDAQHTEALPRDKILIKEGGAPIPLSADPSNDPNEAYSGFKKTYDFYFEFFQRNSVDAKGLPLVGFVHYGEGYLNAFWDGDEMVFGDGDGVVFNGFTDELDVIGHELTHGVIDYTCPLAYQFQSGALNESLADCFGIMVKQWGLDPANPQTADTASWLIGEGIWAKGINGRALRDMAHPGTAYDDPKAGKDDQPGHWDNFLRVGLNSDRGGVHTNSGIPNRAFYLAATGIGGYSWEGAGAIWYKAMSSGRLPNKSTFKQFADLTIELAGEHQDKVQTAWEGVGYPFPVPDGVRDEL